MNFLYTEDKKVADKLIKMGYKLISAWSNDSLYIFENNPTIHFDKKMRGVVFTNILIF